MVSLSERRDVPPWLPEHFVGGHLALNFINTVSHRVDSNLAVDRFDSLVKIATWCEYSGLLGQDSVRLMQDSPSFRGQESTLVKQLTELRSSAGRIFDLVAEERDIPATEFAYVLTTAGAAVASLKIEVGSDGPQIGNSDQPTTPDQLIGLLALQVLDALYCLPHDRLRACPGCRWLFFDGSRGGRRKWCSMQDCGNRAKARRHYTLHKRLKHK